MTTYRPDTLALVGGWLHLSENAHELTDFLSAFDFAGLNMPYWMIETFNEGFQFNPDVPLTELIPSLMRLHCFGMGGDLTIRRDENRVHWRYVGTPFEGLPEGSDYWTANNVTELYMGDEMTALLWGEYDTVRKRWYENRVGAATLTYPVPETNRVIIRAIPLIDEDNDTTAAIWTYALESYSAEAN